MSNAFVKQDLSIIEKEAFYSRMKELVVRAIEDGTGLNAKVEAELRPKGLQLTIRSNKIRNSTTTETPFFNSISAEDYTNTVSEKEFKDKVIDSIESTATKELMNALVSVEKQFKPQH